MQNLRDLSDDTKRSNIHVTEGLEREEKDTVQKKISEENAFEEKFPYLVEDRNVQIQEAKQTINRIHPKVHTQAQHTQIFLNQSQRKYLENCQRQTLHHTQRSNYLSNYISH